MFAQLYETFSALEAPGFWQKTYLDFYGAWFEADRWKQYFQGLGTTIEVTVVALIIGVILGVVVAVLRTAHDQQRPGRHNPVLGLINVMCKVYVTVIRGTPMMVQLLIMGLVIFSANRNKTLIGALSLGINSGAYVAEIIRGGLMSLDPGQMEAGRSLGFNYVQTMWHIIIPQALKNVLPALANEFIVLLKETSVAGYVAVMDLAKGGDIIRGRTFSPFMPLIAVALIYLVMVVFFTWLVSRLERRLRNSEH